MGADVLMAIGFFGVLTGVSAYAVARTKAGQRKTWVEEMEAERKARKFEDLD